jgi:hypothetical protein
LSDIKDSKLEDHYNIYKYTYTKRALLPPHLIVIELESHAVMNFVVLQRDMVLKDCVPFLNANFLWLSAHLRRNQFLEVANRVVLVALHTDFLPQSIVAYYFNHFLEFLLQFVKV